MKPVRNLLRCRFRHPLILHDHAHEIRRTPQAVKRPRIHLGIFTPKQLLIKIISIEHATISQNIAVPEPIMSVHILFTIHTRYVQGDRHFLPNI